MRQASRLIARHLQDKVMITSADMTAGKAGRGAASMFCQIIKHEHQIVRSPARVGPNLIRYGRTSADTVPRQRIRSDEIGFGGGEFVHCPVGAVM